MKTDETGKRSGGPALCAAVWVLMMCIGAIGAWGGVPASAQAKETWKTVVDVEPKDLIPDDPDEDGPIPGGPCEYVDIPGNAQIVSVEPAPPEGGQCNNAVVVLFDFIPDDPRAAETYLYSDWPTKRVRFFVGAGTNPPLAWVKKKGLVQGARHRCLRREQQRGACTPVIYRFPEIDETDWTRDCYGR